MIKALKGSLVLRISLALALTNLVVVGLGSAYLDYSLGRIIHHDRTEALERALLSVVKRLEDDTEPPDKELLEVEEHVMVRVMDGDHRVIIETEGMSHAAPLSDFPVSKKAWGWAEGPNQSGVPICTLSTSYKGGWVQVARDLRFELRVLFRLRKALLLTLGLTTTLAGLSGFWITRRGLRPLGDLAEQADGIEPESLSKRLDVSGHPKEFLPLSDALNRTLARLESAFGRLGTLNADMAHELRTPVHSLKLETEQLLSQPGFAEVTQDRLVSMMETLDHMGLLIEQMLFLARAEDPATVIDRARIDALAFIEGVRDAFEPLAEEARVSLLVDVADNLSIIGDRTLLKRALHNLLANAIRHSHEGQSVVIRAMIHEGVAVLEIIDRGEGIPESHLAQLGERYIRPDASRSRRTGGAGLGLAIVQSIVRLHAGSMRITSHLSEGTTVRLELPQGSNE